MTFPANPRRRSSGNNAVETGATVHLRRPTLEDCDEWVALREGSRDHLLVWEPRQKVRSERERWESFFNTSDTDDRKRFLICLNTDGRIVGYVGLNDIRHGALMGCTTGYWIGKPYARMGYMTEAVGLAIRHAFRTLGLHRVEAGVQPHNIASLGVVRKVGMRNEGTALRFLQIDGKWCDHERWAMTVEEWVDLQAPNPRPAATGPGRKPANSSKRSKRPRSNS